ncbi:competence/damage-inducible protein A [Candidatus Sumerlaeota bacterium]|nr:competence/damage-inducible protein A [Candidatus Sumerlaeota bacterium]
MNTIHVGILSTGTEILQGLYADTNAQWLSARLSAMGLHVVRHVAAPDRARDVADAIAYLGRTCQLVVMTGGLGPTEDDLTRQAVCEAFGTRLREDAKAWRMIVERFRHRGVAPPASNRVQCLIPEGARTLYNLWGTAPGFAIDRPPKGLPWFAALPGPPRENRPMFEKYLEREIARRFARGRIARIRTLHTVGISESALNDRLRALFEEIGDDPDRGIAFLSGDARVDIRLVARGADPAQVRASMNALSARVRRRVPPDCIYGSDRETLEAVVLRLMRKRGRRLAVAESCTGGQVASRLTDIAGSSDVFLAGWVAYSNEAKCSELGVRRSTLERHGAVSAETAAEMARGALDRSGADVAVSVTGIAGPGGGTKEKPVGLVWYGLAWREERKKGASGTVRCETFQTCFRSGREMVRRYASHRALDLVRRLAIGLPLELPKS